MIDRAHKITLKGDFYKGTTVVSLYIGYFYQRKLQF